MKYAVIAALTLTTIYVVGFIIFNNSHVRITNDGGFSHPSYIMLSKPTDTWLHMVFYPLIRLTGYPVYWIVDPFGTDA